VQRYVAFCWPAASEPGAAQAAAHARRLAADPNWTARLQRPGLEVWATRGQRLAVRELRPSGAVVIGDMFDRRTGAATVCVPGLPHLPVAAAQRLAGDTWGAFVALLPDPDRQDDLWVYREPSGYLDAICWRRGGLGFVADDIVSLPAQLAPERLELDWDVITEIAKRPTDAPHRSPLAGITPVVPGDLQRLDRAAAPIAVWRPSAFARTSLPTDSAQLRDAVLAAVGSLASVERRVLIEVSGGLDSAIVTAALVEAGRGQDIAGAVNFFSARPAGDERDWASAVCVAKSLALDAVPQETSALSEFDFAELASHVNPAYGGVDAPYDRGMASRAAALGVSAVFGGQGGDAVFFQMPTAAIAADFLAAYGPAGLTDPFLGDLARWLRRSVWSILGEVRRTRAWIGLEHPLSSRFWGWRARAAPPGPPHPWLADLRGVPPGKQIQIQAILGSQASWGRSRRASVAMVVNPLLAQPLLELGLATPSWRLVAGVRDRGLARQAFSGLLPSAVLQRHSKGALNALFSQRAAAGLEFLRPHLLDGALVEAGVLDHQAIEEALQPDALLWRAEGGRLTRAALLESWVRHWQGRVPDVASTGRAAMRGA
jgi:asparagine synthase (glutamine-hydrolysing)